MRARQIPRLHALGWVVGVGLGLGCGESPPAEPLPPVRVPSRGPLAPSNLQVDVSGDVLADTEACADCHPGPAAEWTESLHRASSLSNPWYTAALAEFVQHKGATSARHCAGCHDPALLADGDLDPAWLTTPGTAPQTAHAGVTCRTCHGGVHTTLTGNASLHIPASGLPIDADTHAAAFAADLEAARGTCVGCHRGVLGPDTGQPQHQTGLDDVSTWEDSAWSGHGTERLDSVPVQDCVDCHMPEVARVETIAEPTATVGWRGYPNLHTEDASVSRRTGRSHRFAGAHRPAASTAAQDAALSSILSNSLSVYVVRAEASDGRLHVDVVLHNTGAGHAWPGGLADTQGTALYVDVTSGEQHLTGGPHPIGASVVDPDGTPVGDHAVGHTRIQAWNTTIPPRGSRLVRFEGTVPAELDLAQATVSARVVHRRLAPALARLGCDWSQSAVGRALSQASEARDGRRVDGCHTPTPLLVAGDRQRVGAVSAPSDALRRATAEAWLARGDEAHTAATLLTDAPEDALLAGRLDAQLGRTDAALQTLLAPQTLATHASLAVHVQAGHTAAHAFRWTQAHTHYVEATEAAPGSVVAWRGRSVAALADNNLIDAVFAAYTGLGLRPHDADLLRVQALARTELGATDTAASAAWLSHRADEDATSLHTACRDADRVCRMEADPSHVHPLLPVR